MKQIAKIIFYVIIYLLYFMLLLGLAVAILGEEYINTIHFKVVVMWGFACSFWFTYLTYLTIYLNKLNDK